MEKWDLYDENYNKINKFAYRGDTLQEDEFHLVINAWIINDKNQFLITQRAPHKSHGCMWECTGGSALAGETAMDTCVREIKEELGIDIDRTTAKNLGFIKRYFPHKNDILHTYIFKSNVKSENIKIQEEEVMNFMWADKDTILKLYKDGKFEANASFKTAIEYTYDNF